MRADMLDPDMAGAMDVVSGAIGLWAVLYSNARAAKLFLRSQTLVYLMNRVCVAIHAFAVPHPSTGGFWTGFAFACLFHVVVALYQLKVGLVFQARHIFSFSKTASPLHPSSTENKNTLFPRPSPPVFELRGDRYSSTPRTLETAVSLTQDYGSEIVV